MLNWEKLICLPKLAKSLFINFYGCVKADSTYTLKVTVMKPRKQYWNLLNSDTMLQCLLNCLKEYVFNVPSKLASQQPQIIMRFFI